MSTPANPAKILFVDDDELVLSGINLTLGRNYSVYTASSGMEGLEVFRKDGPFAVVVSDFNMPQMDGSEFLREVRKLDKEVVTMLLTGAANFADASGAFGSIAAGVAAGAAGFSGAAGTSFAGGTGFAAAISAGGAFGAASAAGSSLSSSGPARGRSRRETGPCRLAAS